MRYNVIEVINLSTNTTYNIRIDKRVRAQADALLRDAAEIDAAIANGTAKVYATSDELFKEWENG